MDFIEMNILLIDTTVNYLKKKLWNNKNKTWSFIDLQSLSNWNWYQYIILKRSLTNYFFFVKIANNFPRFLYAF